MKKFLLSASLLLVSAVGLAAKAELPKPAPQFTAEGADGKKYSLSDFKNKYVILEWWNEECPYVKKHYGSGNMQKLQTSFKEKGNVVWLTVLSSAEGKQGYRDAKAATDSMSKQKGEPTAVLLDPKGEIGKLYGATTTPNMYVINPEGQLIYKGAIDDKPTTDAADIAGAKNFVSLAYDNDIAGKPVDPAVTKPYGCSVKYK